MARVLVVDDENLMRTMVEVACRRLGHEALCAATLAEGRRLAAAGVDVILLDMLSPTATVWMRSRSWRPCPTRRTSWSSRATATAMRRKKPCAAVSGIFS